MYQPAGFKEDFKMISGNPGGLFLCEPLQNKFENFLKGFTEKIT